MNALQKSKIKKLVQEDCEICGSYCIEGKTCVIGKMAIEAGIPPERFDKHNSHAIDSQYLTDVAGKLLEVYGLSYPLLREMQIENDVGTWNTGDHDGIIQQRRERILAYLETIPVEP
jgi:hypothetical protein